MKKNLYVILDSKGNIFPKTHIFILRDDVEAIYTFINFGAILQTEDIELCHVGYSDDNNYIIKDNPKGILCCFTGIPDYVHENISDDFNHPDLSKEIIINAFNIAYERIYLFKEKSLLLHQISEKRMKKESFDKGELERIIDRLQYIDTKLGLYNNSSSSDNIVDIKK